jgi:[ribosomal protein S5]-alanine N-acetyltransferase
MPTPPSFPLVGTQCRLRPWTAADLASLVRHANNRNVSRQLRDVFPYPYTDEDGRGFLAHSARVTPPTALAIVVDGDAVGGVGITPGSGNERRTAEIGYWIGEALWGRGIGPEALGLMTRYAIATFDLVRLEALAITTNARSCRTLEKAGYVREGRTRKSFLKDGELHDQYCYAWVIE